MTQVAQIWCCNNLEEWDEVGGGSEVQEGRGICVSMADSC